MAAHVDSPRLDLKQCPMYETDGLAYFKTHYYGGIRKSQWPTIPLALHGVFSMTDGSLVKVNLGEDENDPVLFITDLLPHLGDAQAKRPLYEGIKGEELNIVIGRFPYKAVSYTHLDVYKRQVVPSATPKAPSWRGLSPLIGTSETQRL